MRRRARWVPMAAGMAATVAAAAMTGCAAEQPTDGGTEPTEVTAADAPVTWTSRDVTIGAGTVAVACAGSGGPTVWLVSDLVTTGDEGWPAKGVGDEVAERTTVCTYDRPGLGASASAEPATTIEEQGDQLAETIRAAEVPTPVVLVGQGYGTFVTRVAAAQDLDLVAGMVLVDPTLWATDAEPSSDATEGERAEYAVLAQINADLGGYGSAALPPPPAPTIVLGAAQTLPAVPPVAGTTPGTLDQASLTPSESERHERQRGLANKSPFGTFELHSDAGSAIQIWDPAAVVAAISAVLDDPDLRT